MADRKDGPKTLVTPVKRSKVVARIDDVRRQAGKCNREKSVALENNLFNGAETMLDYFRSAAKLVVSLQKKIVKPDSTISTTKESSDKVPKGARHEKTDYWKSLEFRAAMTAKMLEAVGSMRIPKLSCADMENSIFTQAKTKEEYLESVSNSILRFRAKKAFYSKIGTLDKDKVSIIEL